MALNENLLFERVVPDYCDRRPSYARVAAPTQCSIPGSQDACLLHLPSYISPLTSTLFFLVLDALHILIWYSAHIHHPIENIVTIVPLHHNLLAADRRLRDTATRRDCAIRQPSN